MFLRKGACQLKLTLKIQWFMLGPLRRPDLKGEWMRPWDPKIEPWLILLFHWHDHSSPWIGVLASDQSFILSLVTHSFSLYGTCSVCQNFPYIISSHLSHEPLLKILLCSFYKWGHWRLERVASWPKLTQLDRRAGIQTWSNSSAHIPSKMSFISTQPSVCQVLAPP